MTQDFAKIRPEPILERKPVETPPAWSLMFTGMIVGLTIGVFACFLFYLSGNVPPLIPNSSLQNSMADMSNEPIVHPVRLFSVAELAKTGKPVAFWRRQINSGALAAYRLGVELFVSEEQLRVYLEANLNTGPAKCRDPRRRRSLSK